MLSSNWTSIEPKRLMPFVQNIPPAPHKIHSRNLLSVIQHNYNTVCIPFQKLILGLVNNIELYHVLHPINRAVFGHDSNARHIIDHCIGFR